MKLTLELTEEAVNRLRLNGILPAEGNKGLGLEHIARITLMDALGEFQTARQPADGYVERRYTWMSEQQQIAKVEEVQKRILLAEILRNAQCAIGT
jgi:hypothetical protein